MNGGGVRVRRRYRATAAEVWAALTEPASLGRWLTVAANVELHQGGAFELRFTEDETTEMSGRVRAIDPGRFLELEWRLPGEPASVVRFELHEEPEGVLLVVDHRGLERARATAYGEGWKRHLERLHDALEPGTGHDPYTLPAGLPVPEDDGGADHLPGSVVPAVALESSQGPVDLAELCAERGVLYVYPRTGRPGRPMLEGWDAIPGARGCTPQSCGFRDHAAELAAHGARVAGLSSQTLDEQVEFAERNRMPFPVIADPELRLRAALGLPTFHVEGRTLYKRLALVAERGRIAKVFYPVFPPDRNASDVLAWLERERRV